MVAELVFFSCRVVSAMASSCEGTPARSVLTRHSSAADDDDRSSVEVLSLDSSDSESVAPLYDSDDDDEGVSADESSGDEGDKILDAAGAEAGLHVLDILMEMTVSGTKMTAKSACILAYWIERAGGQGAVTRLGLPPTSPSGHFARKFRKVTGLDLYEKNHMPLEVPCYSKHDLGRTTMKLPVVPFHEAFAREVQDDPSTEEDLRSAIVDGEWSQSYWAHPIVRRHHPNVVEPISLYVDGVPFTKSDGFVGVWMYSIRTGRRHVAAAIRKSAICRCGCRGWCTMFVIWSYIVWTLEACAEGFYPHHGVFGREFDDEDEFRRGLAGASLGFVAAVINIKSDMMEWATSLGMPSWADKANPCVFCYSSVESLHRLRGILAHSLPWAAKTTGDYLECCDKADIKVTIIDFGMRDLLGSAVEYYKGKIKGGGGRQLKMALPALGLEKGDRLEPTEILPNVALLDKLASFPTTITFWRRFPGAVCYRRTPLLNPNLGLGLEAFAIDVMHCFFLGIVQVFVGEVFWLIVLTNGFDLKGGDSAPSIAQLTVIRFLNEVTRWYKTPQGRHATQVSGLTLKMFGQESRKACKTKAGETQGLMFFCVYLLQGKMKTKLGWKGVALRDAGEKLTALVNHLRDCPRRPSTEDVQADGSLM